jgi:hypothetical protein
MTTYAAEDGVAQAVMAGLVSAIHALFWAATDREDWDAPDIPDQIEDGRPGMTRRRNA